MAWLQQPRIIEKLLCGLALFRQPRQHGLHEPNEVFFLPTDESFLESIQGHGWHRCRITSNPSSCMPEISFEAAPTYISRKWRLPLESKHCFVVSLRRMNSPGGGPATATMSARCLNGSWPPLESNISPNRCSPLKRSHVCCGLA